MDLSNLSSDLPPTKPVNKTSAKEFSRELTTEFRNAAKSVASLFNLSVSSGGATAKQKAEFASAAKSVAALYRLTNSSNTVAHHLGYLECLDELLQVLTNGEDVENWALTKRAEINNMSNTSAANLHSHTATEETHGDSQDLKDVPSETALGEDIHLPTDYAFTFALDLTPSHHFRPGFPPLSVTHSHKQRANLKHLRNTDHLMRLKKQHLHLEESSTTSDECDSDKDNVEDASVSLNKKSKPSQRDTHDVKRRRTNTAP